MMPDTTLAGKTAVVTGVSRGIGAAVAQRLRDADVFVVGLARTVAEHRGDTGWTLPCDVTDPDRVAAVVGDVLARGGGPDILVNNAGTFLMEELTATTTNEFARQLDVNVVGPFTLLRHLVPHLAERGGHVVTVGSVVDHQVFPGNAAYAASKHGLRALHEVLRAEWGERLRTTLVSPGPTDTAAWNPFDPDDKDYLPNRSTMLAAGDVADAVLYAVSRPARVNVDLIRLAPSGLT